MKKIRKFIAGALAMAMLLSLSACGNSPKEPSSGSSKTETAPSSSAVSGSDEAAQTDSGEKILNAGVSFNIASMDAHLDYNGWYTNVYGITEELFKLNENYEVEPWLAEKAESDGKVWTITLKEGIAFSNGKSVTAEMVVKNLQRAAEKNERFAYLSDYEMKALDEKTLTITTPEVYPTMVNDLASPELGIMDLEDAGDIDSSPVCTGPLQFRHLNRREL